MQFHFCFINKLHPTQAHVSLRKIVWLPSSFILSQVQIIIGVLEIKRRVTIQRLACSEAIPYAHQTGVTGGQSARDRLRKLYAAESQPSFLF